MDKGSHWHTSAENIVIYGVSALIFLNLWRIGAAFAARSQNDLVAKTGKAAGALVSFGAS